MSYACSPDSGAQLGPESWTLVSAFELIDRERRQYEREYPYLLWPKAPPPTRKYSDQDRRAAFSEAVECLDAVMKAKVERPHPLWVAADEAREAYRKTLWCFLPPPPREPELYVMDPIEQELILLGLRLRP